VSKNSVVIKVKPGPGKFAEGAYLVHSNKYFTNAAQFIYASNALQEKVKSCTSVTWYMQGMSVELLCKGLLYSHNRKKYAPKILAAKPYRHNLCKLTNELVDQKLLKITDRQLDSLIQLNDFYFENGKHELRYPSLLSIFTEIKPDKKFERPIVEILEKLTKKADSQVGFTKNKKSRP
jgi:hypothetical protein